MTEFLVTGAGGALGSVLMRELAQAGRSASGVISPNGPAPYSGNVWSADITDPRTFRERLVALTPKVIVHFAAMAALADVFRDPDRARRVNVEATAVLIAYAEKIGARFVFASTDLVFDGEAAPYDENSTPEPISIYGYTKLEAECHVLAYKRGLVLRFPLMYGLPEVARKPTFFETLLASLRDQQRTRLFTDEVRTPLWLDDAARACLRAAASDVTGVLHVGGPERLSRFDMGERMASALGVPHALLEPGQRSEASGDEPRAHDVSLDSSRYGTLFGEPPGRSLAESLEILLAQKPNRLLS
jgi:dTDP-4-dehydrorhamnose reductase